MRIVLLTIYLLTITHSHPPQLSDTILVDDFESSDFSDWKHKSKKEKHIYKLSKTEDNQFLSASSLDSDNFIIKKIKVDLVKYPHINWRWRAHTLPDKGDERKKETCDIAASVYVVLKASRWRPRSIKYTWSTTLPEETRTKSPFAIWPSRSDVVVKQTGEAQLGQWVAEKVNVLEDFKAFYNKKNVDKLVIEAICIMTDSDNTSSLSEADYDNIFFSKD